MEALPSQPGRPPLRTAADGLPRPRDPISLGRSSSASSRSDFDSPSFSSSASTASVSQSLSSILNNPHAGRSDASWSLWWPSASAATPDPPPPLTPSISLTDVSRADFQPYLSAIFESYSRFEDVRNHSSKETAAAAAGDGEVRGLGEALVACLREVPSLFFKEDFALEEGTTFRAACPFSPLAQENTALQERLTQYLDVVEMHLVREISLRSNSFFEAQGQLQSLNGEIVEACVRIRELKETIRILTGDLVGTARQVQELNATRGNLVALQQKLTVILQVVQIFHSHISEAFSKLDVCTPQAKNRLCRDVQHILGCICNLPSDNSSEDGVPNFGLLDEFLAEHFGTKVGK